MKLQFGCMKESEGNQFMNTRTATLALIVQNSKLLLGHKIRKGADIGEGSLNGPGGKLESGQSLLECLRTETFEEIGLTIADEGVEEIAVITFHNGTSSKWTVHVYLVHSWEGEPSSTEEMIEPEQGWWYHFDALPFHRMLASDQEWLPLALSGKRFRVDVFQNDDASEVLKPLEFQFF